MVQNIDNRLPLNSVDSNQQLSEFQLVHAIITQSGKNADDNTHNNNKSHPHGVQNVDSNLNKSKREFISKDEKSVLQRSVMTICNTFNALAQATNPSLCAKQNKLHHPISLASTVKRIISQFSRPCHGPLCLASPNDLTPPPTAEASSAKNTHVGNQPITKRNTVVHRASNHHSSPSGTTTHVVRVKEKESPPSEQKPSPEVSQRGKSPRLRNSYGLTRHVSAPIPFPRETRESFRPSASVKRSKSDSSSYAAYYRRSRTKIDSNVKTKVQHFENCCKDKGNGAMCLECQTHSLEQGDSPEIRASSAPSGSLVLENPDKYIGALSYHKPSTISQSSSFQNTPDGCNAVASSPSHSPTKTGPPTAPRTKSIACPGGVYFLPGSPRTPSKKDEEHETCNGIPSRQASSVSSDLDINSMEVVTPEPIVPAASDNEPDHETSSSAAEVQCSQMKRKHSVCEEDDTQSNRKEFRDDSYGNTETLHTLCNIEPELDNHESSSDSADRNNLGPAEDLFNPPSADENMYSLLLSATDNAETDAADDGKNVIDVLVTTDKEHIEETSSLELRLPLGEETSESLDDNSSSSSSESCPSPRQSYLTRRASTNSLHRRPSNRYQRMRRKLKRLLGRPQSYPEALPVDYCFNAQSQSEQEQIYLESIRIPAPCFMVQNSQSSFIARRQQVAIRLDHKDWMSALPDNVLLNVFSYLDTRSLANLKCVCKDFGFLIDTYDIRGTDSMWVRDERYMDDPCKYCRRRFTSGDVSMCRYHSKTYHCDLPYGRSYWICCFKIERNAPGCKTGIHNNDWRTPPVTPK